MSLSTDSDTPQRLEALELKVMDLELVLQQLNEVVISQYQDIERLRGEQQRLQSRLDEALDNPRSSNPGHEVPPHY